MCLQFLLVTINYRMVARASYIGTVLSDVAILWLGFTVMRKVSQAETRSEQVGYTIGGAIGSVIGLYLT